ncbi:MAG: hypothetical protein PVI59_05695 [Anaerolineae bacterium]
MDSDRLLLGLIVLLVFVLSTVGLTGCGSGEKGVLLEDRFGNPGNGWGVESQEAFDRGYQNGEYFIEVYEPNWLTWARPEERFNDVAVEAEVRWVSGSRDGHFGLLCRYRPGDSFYYFAITDDGFYAILRVSEGVPEVISGDGFMSSTAILTGGETNVLRAVCQGEQLTLFVNGEQLATASDTAFLKGDVGLAVGSGPEGSIRVHFDNLTVTTPGVTDEEEAEG